MTVRSMYVYNGATWDEVGYTVSHDIPADGTTGQVLAKVSATDYDTAWADPDRFTVDAKGDLLVGTAADTVGRLAVGSDGTSLIADSGATAGVKWAAMQPEIPVGVWALAPGHAGTGSATTTQGRLALYPVEIPHAMTISDVSVRCTGAAAAGALWRIGFWLCDGTNGQPNTLIADCGTVDPTGTGDKTITGLTVALPAGRVAIGYALQGTGAGGGSMQTRVSGWLQGTGSQPPVNSTGWYITNGVTGAFGGTLTLTGVASFGLAMQFAVKRSA